MIDLKKIAKALVLITPLLTGSVYAADCGTNATIEDVQKVVDESHSKFFKLSPEQKAKVNAEFGSPPLDEPYDLYVLQVPAKGSDPAFSRMVIIREGCMMGAGNMMNTQPFMNFLGLVEANGS